MAQRNNNSAANLGFEDKLWAAADQMRGHMDPSEYKHVVLGLIFLKYISDAFQEHYEQLTPVDGRPGQRVLHRARRRRATRCWRTATSTWPRTSSGCRKQARWTYLQDNAKQPDIGQIIDDAMVAIEQANPSLKGVLPKDYARPDAQQAAPGRAHRPDRHHRPGRQGEPLARTSWAGSTSTSWAALPTPRASAAASSTRRSRIVQLLVADAGALPGPRLRPLLRLGRHVRAVGAVCRGARRQPARHRHLRPGVQPHHLAAVQDEPGHPRHRRQHRPQQRRHLPQRPAQGPARRLHPGQPALQHEASGARQQLQRRRALAVRRRRPTATPTTPGCST